MRTRARNVMDIIDEPEVKPNTKLIFDCQSIFQLIERLRDFGPNHTVEEGEIARPLSFDYGAAQHHIEQLSQPLGFQRPSQAIAIATSDPASEPQSRFFAALAKRGIDVHSIDFRHATPTLPMGVEYDKIELKLASVVPEIAYAMGLLAPRSNPELILVTRCFELYGPLNDFIKVREGKAAIAFFRRYMDGRWAQNGLFDSDSPIRFIDLEPVAKHLVGIDLRAMVERTVHRSALAGF